MNPGGAEHGRKLRKQSWWPMCLALWVTPACGQPDTTVEARDAGSPPSAAIAIPAPPDNPLTPEAFALGRRLFHDPRLSRTGDVSCASCHLQEHAFADPRPVSVGVDGRTGTRNAPALVNLAWASSFFWDGGVDTLERQAMAPIESRDEMDLPLDEAVARLQSDETYAAAFAGALGGPPTAGRLVRALASFMRGLVSRDSPWDRFRAGDASALSEAERRGHEIFFGEAGGCFHCHDGPDLTVGRFFNNGTYVAGADEGRQRVTLAERDRGRFKVPTLRNVAVTAPYMHDGSIDTLEAVVDHYQRGGNGNPSTDPVLHSLNLTAAERSDLVAFLRALTDQAFLHDPRFAR